MKSGPLNLNQGVKMERLQGFECCWHEPKLSFVLDLHSQPRCNHHHQDDIIIQYGRASECSFQCFVSFPVEALWWDKKIINTQNTRELPSSELAYPDDKAYLKMIFPFLQVGYVSFLEGKLLNKNF